ncbi:MAG: hypothetical protein ACO1RX_22450 [Candidatus Sericytochromatia bacterium]
MKRMQLISLATLVAASLSACDANVNVSVPSPSASASSSATPSASPSTSPSADPSTTPSAQPSSAPQTGSITMVGADVFNNLKVDFKPGMKWVYGMKSAVGGISFGTQQLPPGFSLPPGVSIPGVGGSGSGSGSASGSTNLDLGDMTLEVISVTGDMVTMRTTLSLKVGAASPAPTETTFPKSEGLAKVFVQAAAQGTSGTITFIAAGSESVTVPAQTYTAEKITATMDVTQTSGSATANVDQDLIYWMVNGIGFVKMQSKAKVSGSSSGGNAAVDTTTVIELKSFDL